LGDLLQPPLGRGGTGGAEQVPGPDRTVPAAQPLQALLLLIQLGQGHLALGHLAGQLGVVLAAVSDELRPLGLPLRGEQALQLRDAGLLLGHRQHHRLPAGRRDRPGDLSEPGVERLALRQRPGALLQRHRAQPAQLPPDRHPVPRRVRRQPVAAHPPGHRLTSVSGMPGPLTPWIASGGRSSPAGRKLNPVPPGGPPTAAREAAARPAASASASWRASSARLLAACPDSDAIAYAAASWISPAARTRSPTSAAACAVRLAAVARPSMTSDRSASAAA